MNVWYTDTYLHINTDMDMNVMWYSYMYVSHTDMHTVYLYTHICIAFIYVCHIRMGVMYLQARTCMWVDRELTSRPEY